MKTKNIMIVGVGGQGSLLASKLLGRILLTRGYDIKVSEVHGMSQRGGSVVTYVRFGDKVYSPVIDKGEADYIVSFELLEAARWTEYLKPDGKIIVNTQQINPMPVIIGAAQYPEDLVAKMKLLPNEQFTRGQKVLFIDDSIVRGTQLKDNVVKLLDSGVKEIHMRIACPPLIFPCKFLNFSTSRSTYDLYTRRVIRDMEGTDNIPEEVFMQYADPESLKHKEMIEVMRKHLQLTSLKFQKLDDLVAAIGLPKCDLCTHCWDNSSYTE